MTEKSRFDAFLCHSTRADGALVSALRDELHRKSRPFFGLRRIHLFQDRSDFRSSPTLWSSLELRLAESKVLLVIATPESEKSPGMDKEIAWWLEHRGLDSLHIVALRGRMSWDGQAQRFSPGDSVPERLQTAYAEEPFFFDLRGYRAPGRGLDDFTDDTFWSLLAMLMGTTADAVRRSDRRRRRVERVTAVGALASIGIAVAFGINARLDARLQGQERALLERNAKADRSAASAVANREDDPAAAASHALTALATARTTNAVAEAYRTALRWPFLEGILRFDEIPEAMFLTGSAAEVFACTATRGKLLDLGKLRVVATLDLPVTVALDGLPPGWIPRCAAQKRHALEGHFLTVFFAPQDAETPTAPVPGPTVFLVAGGEVRKIRDGAYGDTADGVCRAEALVGFAFALGGRAWLCGGASAQPISSGEEGVSLVSLIASDDGRTIVAFDSIVPWRDPACDRPSVYGMPEPNCPPSEEPRRQLRVFDATDGSIITVPVELEPGDQIVSVTTAQTMFRGYQRFGSIQIGEPNRGSVYEDKPAEWDVDAFDETPVGDEWRIRSSLYSGTERDRSFVDAEWRGEEVEFERFGAFTRTAAFIFISERGRALVASRDGQVELYSFRPSAPVVTVRRSPGIKRFETCDPVRAPGDDTPWMLALGPAGDGLLIAADDLDRQQVFRADTNIYRSEQSDDLGNILGLQIPDWLVSRLADRWRFARALHTGLNDIRVAADGAVLAGIDTTTFELVVRAGGKEIRRGTAIESGGGIYSASVRVSRSGRLVGVSTGEATAVYTVDAEAGSLSLLDTLSGAMTAFSDDDHELAVVDGLNARVYALSCPSAEPCASPALEELFTTADHLNGITEIAFDRRLPLLYTAGHDHRLVIHDTAIGARLDAGMKVHTDTIEGLCTLSGGGVLTLDQSETLIHWQLSEEAIHRRLVALSSLLSSP